MRLFLTLPLLLLCSCLDSYRGDRITGQAQRTLTDSQTAPYFAWDGGAPVVLLGLSTYSVPFAHPHYPALLNELTSAGGNAIAVDLGYEEVLVDTARTQVQRLVRYGQKMTAATYRSRLLAFVEACSDRNVAIVFHDRGKPSDPPTYIEYRNSLGPSDLEGRIELISEAPRVSQYHSALLMGSAGAIYLPPSETKPLELASRRGRELNSLRALRTIQNDFKFWELTSDSSIVLRPDLTGSIAARTDDGDYLIYVPRSGKVRVRLAAEAQPTYRVSVVGRLGTRRSEVLKPPYGPVFELTNEDDDGAWLLFVQE